MTTSSLNTTHFIGTETATSQVAEKAPTVKKSRKVLKALIGVYALSALGPVKVMHDKNEADSMYSSTMERGCRMPGARDTINKKLSPLSELSSMKTRLLETLPVCDAEGNITPPESGDLLAIK